MSGQITICLFSKRSGKDKEIEDYISTLELKTMGIKIDELSEEQNKYLNSWEMGT